MTGSAPKTTPESEFCRNFGRYKDEAIAAGAIAVTSNGRPVGAYLSQIEYERYLALKRLETRVHRLEDLPDDILEDIANAQHGVIAE